MNDILTAAHEWIEFRKESTSLIHIWFNMGSAIAQGSLNSMHSITSYRFRKQVGIVHAAPFHDSDYLSFLKRHKDVYATCFPMKIRLTVQLQILLY